MTMYYPQGQHVLYNIIILESSIFFDHNHMIMRGRDGIVEETPVHVYYAYLKPT